MQQDLQERAFVRRRLEHAKAFLTTSMEGVTPAFVQSSVSALNSKVVSPLASLGSPLLDAIDGRLGDVYVSVDTWRQGEGADGVAQSKVAGGETGPSEEGVPATPASPLVDSRWFGRVDRVLKSTMKHASDAQVNVSEFFSAAVDAFSSLDTKTFPAFAAAVRARLSHWNEAYVEPTRVFYTEACNATLQKGKQRGQASLEQIRTKVSAAWQASVESYNAGRAQLVSNSQGLYRAAVQHYLRATGKQQPDDAAAADVDVSELIESLRAQLGAMWNEHLRRPLVALFIRAKQAARSRLVAEAEREDGDAPTKPPMTVGDVAETARDAGNAALLAVDMGWSRALELSESTVDTLLPAQKGEPLEEERRSVRRITSRVVKRLRTRVHSGWESLKSVNPRQLAPEQLVSYADSLVAKASAMLKPRAEQLQTGVVNPMRARLEAVREPLARAIAQTRVRAQELRTTLAKRTAPHTKTLRTKVTAVVERVRLLSTTSWSILAGRRLDQLHRDTWSTLTQATGFASKSSDFELVEQQVIDLVHSLSNLVFWWRAVEVDEQVEEEQVEEEQVEEEQVEEEQVEEEQVEEEEEEQEEEEEEEEQEEQDQEPHEHQDAALE